MWNKSIISAVLCLIGCSIQLIDISSRYFKYSTKPNVQIKLVVKLETPSVSICWMIPNTLDLKKVETKFGVRLSSKNGKVDKTKLYKLLRYMTATETHEMTHSNDSLLTDKLACAIKDPKKLVWHYPWYDRTDCHKLVRITKYFHRFWFATKLKK